MVVNPARGQLNRKNVFSPVEFGLTIRVRQSRPASVCSFSILRLNLVLTYGIPPEFRGGLRLLILNRHTLSGQSRVYRVMQLRTGGAHRREFSGTRPVVLKAGTFNMPTSYH